MLTSTITPNRLVYMLKLSQINRGALSLKNDSKRAAGFEEV